MNDVLRPQETHAEARVRVAESSTGGNTHDTYETPVNSINGIVWGADARTWRFTLVSHQAEAMLGYPAP